MSEIQLDFKEIEINSKDYRLELDLRDRLLRRPLGLSIQNDDLAGELYDRHIGCYHQSRLIGVLVIKTIDNSNVKIRQVAIDHDYQGCGVGSKLMTYAEAFVKDLGYNKITLHSRKRVELFYNKLGYQKLGDMFMEVGIEHVAMYKTLD